MIGLLVRVGVDQAYGNWNAPVDPDTGKFVYVPIPEKLGTKFHPGLERKYSEVLPFLNRFYSENNYKLRNELRFPDELSNYYMHLDPDFDELTYGNKDNPRGSKISKLEEGDLIVFYAGLRPIRQCQYNLIYAIIGLYVVSKVVQVSEIRKEKWKENAHTRKINSNVKDVVVYAKKDVSGRLKLCIPIGEWRNKAYRVRQDILDIWGGLSVKDGFIQRSAVPPSFLKPEKFYDWFLNQKIRFIKRNN